MHVSTYVCVYNACVREFECKCVLYVCTQCIHVCMHVICKLCAYLCVCNACVHVCMYAWMHVCMYVFV